MGFSNKVMEILCEGVNLAPDRVVDDCAVSELAIDSLTFMDRIMRIEEEEDVILSDDEVNNVINAFRLSEIVAIFDIARKRREESR